MSHEIFQKEDWWENFFTIIFHIPWFMMNDDGNDLTYNINFYNSTCQLNKSKATSGKWFSSKELILMNFSSTGMDLTSVLAIIVRAGRSINLSAQRGGWGFSKNLWKAVASKKWRWWGIIYRFSISWVKPLSKTK